MKSVGFCGMGVNKVKEAGKTLYQHIPVVAVVGLAFLPLLPRAEGDLEMAKG
jgi:hypothetical protein